MIYGNIYYYFSELRIGFNLHIFYIPNIGKLNFGPKFGISSYYLLEIASSKMS